MLRMYRDNILMIPHLSKELSLIGFPTLPYTLEKTGKTRSHRRRSEDATEVIFNSRLMIGALTSICFELIKQVKIIGEDENNDLDKLNFENLKLQKQVTLNKLEAQKVMTQLAVTKKTNQQLQEKVDDLQKKLRQSETIQKNLTKRHQTNEDILKHALKKKESDIFQFHKAIWKQFNMADLNYLPRNFELIKINQPNFSKLWGTVKYSDIKTKEEALKKAICLLQNNSKTLMEENFSLKISFLTVLQEINEIFKLMVNKLHMPDSVLISFKINEIFDNVDGFNVPMYMNVLLKHFEVFRKLCDLFDESSFTVSDDLFVCWNNITKKL